MNLMMVCGVLVWCSFCASECMLTVSNALVMSNTIVIARSVGLFWLKPVVMLLFMLCSSVFVKWLLLKPHCMEYCLLCMVVVFSYY